jgi:hypothetical protein
MDSTPTPGTIGELAIYMGTKLEFIEKQLDGLPSRVQALEAKVENQEKRSLDRRAMWISVSSLAVAIAAIIVGALFR